MSIRKKRPNVVMGVPRLTGAPGPALLTGTIGYWDARDLTNGAVTTWAPRWSDGLIGGLTGTGTKTGSGVDHRVDQPLFMSDNIVSVSGLDNTDMVGMWLIASVYTIGGSGTQPRSLIDIGSTDLNVGGVGFFWFNFTGNKIKLVNNLSTYTTADGLSDPSLSTKYLWILNRDGASTVRMHSYTEDGTSTTVGTPNWASSSRLYIGRDSANHASWQLDGGVYAFGILNQNIDASGITNLRQWANIEFGVVN